MVQLPVALEMSPLRKTGCSCSKRAPSIRRKLSAILLALSCFPVTPLAAASEPVMMQSTPTGVGDPNAVVCRAPQHIAGSDQLGPQVCLKNSEWWKMAMDGKDIASDGKSLIDRPTVKNPKGEGDPDAITCRTPQFVWSGPPVKICRLNIFWADLIKSNEMVDARGNVVPRWRPDYSLFNGFGGNPLGSGGSGMSDSGNMPSGGPAPH